MNQKYFLAVMAIRSIANKEDKRVKGVVMLDDTGLIYEVTYHGGDFQQFKIGNFNSEIVYITKINELL